MENDEKFSEDETENLRIENEFLRIKLKAQYGEGFQMQSFEDMRPEVENQFLRNILAYEEISDNAEMTTVYKKIGSPLFVKMNELDPAAISPALAKLTSAMEKEGIFLDIADGPYPDTTIYQFITEELFAHEIETEPVFGPGWNFIYEEFHPNNKADIERNTHGFFKNWISNGFNEFSTELAYHFITPDGRQMDRPAFFKMMQHFYASFQWLEKDGYHIDAINFSEMENYTAMGFSEGVYKYDAVLESGELIHYEGPFKLYLQRVDNSWDIFYFVMPGFAW